MLRFIKRILYYFMKDGYSYSVSEEVLRVTNLPKPLFIKRGFFSLAFFDRKFIRKSSHYFYIIAYKKVFNTYSY